MREFRDGKRRRPKASPAPPAPPMRHQGIPRRGPGSTYRVWMHDDPNDTLDIRARTWEEATSVAARVWALRDDWQLLMLRGVIVE